MLSRSTCGRDPIRGGEPARKKCSIRLRRLTLWMLVCLTAVCLLPGRAEASGKPSAGGTDPSAPRRQSIQWTDRPATGRITGEPGGGARCCISKKRGTNK